MGQLLSYEIKWFICICSYCPNPIFLTSIQQTAFQPRNFFCNKFFFLLLVKRQVCKTEIMPTLQIIFYPQTIQNKVLSLLQLISMICNLSFNTIRRAFLFAVQRQSKATVKKYKCYQTKLQRNVKKLYFLGLIEFLFLPWRRFCLTIISTLAL